MENQIKVNLWVEELLKELNESNLTSFKPTNLNSLRIVNRQYDVIFDLLLKGKTIQIANLELFNTTLSQAVNAAEIDDYHKQKVSIYSADDYKEQNTKLARLITSEQLYLTFGILDYYEDNKIIIKSAPLVFVPIKLEYIEEKNTYQVSALNHELLLNDELISKLIDTRRIDLSYPIENHFSLVEYLTYVATKVRNHHFSVNNGCFIASFNTRSHYIYRDFLIRKKQISELQLVKSVSYINSEFFNLNKSNSSRLDNHFLSLLDLDNEEYRILKRLNLRENAVIKTNYLKNKEHLLVNILTNYLLNNKKVLVTYDDEGSYNEFINLIKSTNLEEFMLDLSIHKTNKKDLLNKITSQDKLLFDIKLLDENRIDENVDTYYLLKNDFNKLINYLRKNNEPFNMSINNAMDKYFSYRDLPLIDINIPNADIIDQSKMQEYITAIKTFVTSLSNLNCYYVDHPFYGFNDLTLSQENYLKLREQIISLSAEFEPAKTAYNILSNKYGFPFPKTLKEMKSILNIISVLEECISLPAHWFEIDDLNAVLNELNYHNITFNKLVNLKSRIVSIYHENVFLIDINELENSLKLGELSRKQIRYYQKYFSKRAKIDESLLKRVLLELKECEELNREVMDLYKSHQDFVSYYSEGLFDIDAIQNRFVTIKKFKDNCEILSLTHGDYSYKNISSITQDKLTSLGADRKRGQIAFNHLLNYLKYIQNYFDINLVDFTSLPLPVIENKISSASKNFSAINDYLDFYLTNKKLNKIIPHLGDNLLKFPQIDQYINMFMKRFYYDYASTLLENNTQFKKYAADSFTQSIINFKDYNYHRLEIIDALIKNNTLIKLKENAIAIKSIENPYVNSINTDELFTLPLNILLDKLKATIQSTFSILLVPISEVSSLFINQSYHFDLNIVYSNSDLLTRSVLPSASRADQLIVLDHQLINNQSSESLIYQTSENFIYSSLQSLSKIQYIASTYTSNILNINVFDESVKRNISERLKKYGYIVNTNVNTTMGTLDIVCRVGKSKKATAIIIDRLNYYSFESAIDAFKNTQEKVELLGYACHRIITPIYFLNEEDEFNKLIDFIIKNSEKDKDIKKINKIKPLIDVLFSIYPDPEDTYHKIKNKKDRSQKEVMLEFLTQCAPIRIKDVYSIFSSNAASTLSALDADGVVSLTNGFVFLIDQTIEFRRCDKDTNQVRNLETVSNEEIANGIYRLVNQQPFKEDALIKLILSSLGLRKMNHSQYFRIQNIIGDLLDSKIINIKDDMLVSNEI